MLAYTHFSKYETNLFKGMGMLLIIFHNYFHIIPPFPGQNEFTFLPQSFENYISLLVQLPFYFIRFTLAYFGHYGVQLFIFFSAYGLCLSYKEKEIYYFSFLKKRILKLYPTLLIVVALLLTVIVFYDGFHNPPKLKSILLKLTLLFNFIPGEALSVSGPWWFFSLIVQLYIIFPFLLFLTKKYGYNMMLAVMLIAITITILFNPFFINNNLNLYFTFIGQMSVFCLGIYFASKPRITISTWVAMLAILVFSFGNVGRFVWHFSFLAFTILSIVFFILLKPYSKNLRKPIHFISYTGSISLSLFAIHGMVRIPFEYLSEIVDTPLFTTLLSLLFLAATYGCAYIVRHFVQKLQKFIAA